MNENQPKISEVEKIKRNFAEIKRNQEIVGTALEALTYVKGAVDYFKLGLELGKIENNIESEKLVAEINEYITDRKKRLNEQFGRKE